MTGQVAVAIGRAVNCCKEFYLSNSMETQLLDSFSEEENEEAGFSD